MLPAVLMHHQHRLELTRSALVVVDMQEDFRTKIADFAETAERIAVMMQPVRWNWLCLS
jgi:isochorismate hydrolase